MPWLYACLPKLSSMTTHTQAFFLPLTLRTSESKIRMAKDPAFLFYPGDWLGGTMTFSRHHKGAYMDLLMAQFNQVALTIEDIQQVLGVDFQLWETKLKSKFESESNGTLFYNKKLREEVIRRKQYTQSRRNNLNKSHMEHHMAQHMETETETVIKATNTTKPNKGVRRAFTPPTLEQIQVYCQERGNKVNPQYFYNRNTATGWVDKNGNKYKDWKAVIRTWESFKEAISSIPVQQAGKRPVAIVVVEKIAIGKSDRDILHDLVGVYTEHAINEALMQARGKKQ